jgi:hypothetical protein
VAPCFSRSAIRLMCCSSVFSRDKFKTLE